MEVSRCRSLLFALLSCSVSSSGVCAPSSRDFAQQTSAFLDQHCTDCHDAATQKGGVNLETLDPEMNGREQTDLWTRAFDRVSRGEMPPAKRERPAPADLKGFLDSVSP